jgi:hypothetical protein
LFGALVLTIQADKKQKIDLSFGEGMICGEPSPGFGGKVYQLPVNTPMLPDFSKMTSLGQIEALNLNVAPRAWTTGFPGLDKIGVSLQEWFGIQFLAKLEVPVDGRYEFRTNSDDGSKLFVDNAIVVNNDGTHPPTVMSGSADLKKGNVPLKIEWFQGPKTQIALQVYWKKPGSASWEIIPSNVIKHRKDCKLREIGKFP